MTAEQTRTIRDARPDEAAELALIMDQALAARDSMPLPTVASAGTLATVQRGMERDRTRTRVAVDNDDMIAGFVQSHPNKFDSTGEHVALLMVAPGSQGQGFGRLLIDKVADDARTAGRNRLSLSTEAEDNEDAHAFYHRLGFHAARGSRSEQTSYVLPLRPNS